MAGRGTETSPGLAAATVTPGRRMPREEQRHLQKTNRERKRENGAPGAERRRQPPGDWHLYRRRGDCDLGALLTQTEQTCGRRGQREEAAAGGHGATRALCTLVERASEKGKQRQEGRDESAGATGQEGERTTRGGRQPSCGRSWEERAGSGGHNEEGTVSEAICTAGCVPPLATFGHTSVIKLLNNT